MKRILAIAIPLFLLLVLYAALASATTVNFKWDYDFSVDPSCSTTLITNCVDHFEFWDGTVGTGTLITSFPAPAGMTTLSSGMTTTGTVKGYGSHIINFIAVAKDSSGNPVQSTATTATTVVRPGPPKNVSVQ